VAKPLRFCPTHHIAYNTSLDPSCPQCSVGRMVPPAPLLFSEDFQHPVAADGKTLLDPLTLQPTGQVLP
jgi:hypothetical protein